MATKFIEKPSRKSSVPKRLSALIALFGLILVCIVVIRSFPAGESQFVDQVAGEIQQEMVDNQIVLSSKGSDRKSAGPFIR